MRMCESCRNLPWWLAAILIAMAPLFAADDTRAAKAEQDGTLKALDAAIVRYEKLVDRIDDPKVGATARAFLANYRERRDALRRSYDATKHDELKFDINVESHRLAQWLAPPRTPPPVAKGSTAAQK